MKLTVALLALISTCVTANPGVCVVTKCGVILAECMANSVCRKWQECILGCGLTPNLKCQIRCADLYKPTDATSKYIDEFSECAISENKCVPQEGKAADCKVPANLATLPSFDKSLFTYNTAGNSTWYVTRGHNPLFDCFDCQVHDFSIVTNTQKSLHGHLAYLVKEDLNCTAPDCHYLPRAVDQAWSTDPSNSAHLLNHNNTLAEMHYADDWYVLSSKQNTYVLVYYCGCNDAACGYGGAVLYTRDPKGWLSKEDKATITKAVADADVDFTFDSMCTPSNLACT